MGSWFRVAVSGFGFVHVEHVERVEGFDAEALRGMRGLLVSGFELCDCLIHCLIDRLGDCLIEACAGRD